MKISKKKSQAVKHLVLDCMITRMSNQETIDHIQKKLDHKLNYNSLAKIKMNMRNEAKDYLYKLRSDSFEYHYEFLQRITELRFIERKVWELYDATESEFIKIQCLKEAQSLIKSISDLYDVAPLVTNTPAYVQSLVPKSEEDKREFNEEEG